jgi:hypothetical protein
VTSSDPIFFLLLASSVFTSPVSQETRITRAGEEGENSNGNERDDENGGGGGGGGIRLASGRREGGRKVGMQGCKYRVQLMVHLDDDALDVPDEASG